MTSDRTVATRSGCAVSALEAEQSSRLHSRLRRARARPALCGTFTNSPSGTRAAQSRWSRRLADLPKLRLSQEKCGAEEARSKGRWNTIRCLAQYLSLLAASY